MLNGIPRQLHSKLPRSIVPHLLRPSHLFYLHKGDRNTSREMSSQTSTIPIPIQLPSNLKFRQLGSVDLRTDALCNESAWSHLHRRRSRSRCLLGEGRNQLTRRLQARARGVIRIWIKFRMVKEVVNLCEMTSMASIETKVRHVLDRSIRRDVVDSFVSITKRLQNPLVHDTINRMPKRFLLHSPSLEMLLQSKMTARKPEYRLIRRTKILLDHQGTSNRRRATPVHRRKVRMIMMKMKVTAHLLREKIAILLNHPRQHRLAHRPIFVMKRQTPLWHLALTTTTIELHQQATTSQVAPSRLHLQILLDKHLDSRRIPHHKKKVILLRLECVDRSRMSI